MSNRTKCILLACGRVSAGMGEGGARKGRGTRHLRASSLSLAPRIFRSSLYRSRKSRVRMRAAASDALRPPMALRS
jgi:hypothetical protein